MPGQQSVNTPAKNNAVAKGMHTTITVSAPLAPAGQPAAPPSQKAAKIRPALSNESNGVALGLSDIRKHLVHLAKGWPRVAAGLLCHRRKDPKTGRKRPEYIRDAADLCAWMDDFCHVDWRHKSGRYTKEEFLRHL